VITKRCDRIAGRLSATTVPLAEASVARSRDATHIATCLRCQLEVARYRRLGRMLDELRPADLNRLRSSGGRGDRGLVPDGLVAQVFSAVERAAVERAALRSATNPSASGAAALVASTGVVVAAVLIVLAPRLRDSGSGAVLHEWYRLPAPRGGHLAAGKKPDPSIGQ